MDRIIIALGSNLADPAAAVQLGWRCMVASLNLRDARLSQLHLSRPAEGAVGADFVNAVGVGYTRRDPESVLRVMQKIERCFGRDREAEAQHRARPLDLDLIDHGGKFWSSPELILPHPRMAERDFVLAPLCELLKDFVDLRSGQRAETLLRALSTDQRFMRDSQDAESDPKLP